MSEDKTPFLAADELKRKKIDTQLDKIFVKHIIKAIQSLDNNIGALYSVNTNTIFFMYGGIVIYTLIMNEYNVSDIKIEQHKETVRKRLEIIRSGTIPEKDMLNIKKSADNINIKGLKLL